MCSGRIRVSYLCQKHMYRFLSSTADMDTSTQGHELRFTDCKIINFLNINKILRTLKMN